MNEKNLWDIAKAFAASRLFPDATDAAQAFVRIQAGRELGFGPVASMTGIQISRGRVTIAANLMAAAIKRSERYDYTVAQLDDTTARLAFFEIDATGARQPLGESAFSRDDADTAGLDKKDVWKSYPRNMLFARALSNGFKWYTPDLTNCPVYTPEELDLDIDDADRQAAPPDMATPPNMDAPPSTPAPDLPPEPETPETPTEPAAEPNPYAVDAAAAELDAKHAGTDLARLNDLIGHYDITAAQQTAWCTHFGVDSLADLSQADVDAIVRKIEATLTR